ncbi:MAG: glycerol-3-phosphate ABC transporter [Cereibacter sphaeroides]|uniref:Glycerol-3-phosphate ABC transporter n=1 Tax=Cereibacter sphaeroides TaxID=1063 RepID=A0A2W5UCK4_CERSP|nr:MAG: glycerol-3-phosphate ABC transporter [Cereibacter sphaeroides]
MANQTSSRWNTIYLGAAALIVVILGLLLWVTPADDEGIKQWFDPMIAGGWMAWTLPTALFFLVIGALLILFTILAIRFPETPRMGILHIETTRGDRLFITLLGSAFIHLITLAVLGADLIWVAPILCLVYAAAVFRWV